MNESNIGGVSVRAILAIIIVVSCCAVAVWKQDIESLKYLAVGALSFYFGQKSSSGNNVPSIKQPLEEKTP